MAIVFVFFTFLFYRIMSAALFYDPLTIWGSALIAIVVTIFLTLAGPAAAVFSYVVSEGRRRVRPLRFSGVVIAGCATSCLAGYLIAFGFSERLYQDISHWSRYDEFWEQDLFCFLVMISIPVVVHMIILLRQFKEVE